MRLLEQLPKIGELAGGLGIFRGTIDEEFSRKYNSCFMRFLVTIPTMQKIAFPLLSFLLLVAAPVMLLSQESNSPGAYPSTGTQFFQDQNPIAQMGDKSLPRASLGERFPSRAAEAFLNAFQSRNWDLHSVMIVKDGKVTYERWFGEHSPTKLHEMYSVSKTWTSMAAGFAIKENLFSLDDKIISFFPDDLPEVVSENLAEMRIRDLLTMSTGHDYNQTWTWIEAEKIPTDPWEKYFFAQPVPHKPGTKWVYNSLATHMISALIQKLTGEKLIDYGSSDKCVPCLVNCEYF